MSLRRARGHYGHDDDAHPGNGGGRHRLRRRGPRADGRRPTAAVDDRPAHGCQRLRRAAIALPRPDGRHVRPARARPQRSQGRPGRPFAHGPGGRCARRHRGARRRPGRDVRDQRGRRDRARARGAPSRRPGHARGARAAAHRRAPGRRGGRARPCRLSRRLRGGRAQCRHGGLHRDDVVGGRVHRRVLRPPGAGPRPARDADRRRRVPRQPPALRPVVGGQRLPPRGRSAGRRADAHRGRGRRGVRHDVHGPHGRGDRRAARSGGDRVPQPPRRLPRRRVRIRRAAGGLRAQAARGARRSVVVVVGGAGSGRRRGAVLLVGDMLAPGDGAAGVVGFLHGEVGHEPVGGGAVPVVLAGLEVHAIAGLDDLDRPAFALAAADALGDEDRLAVRVRMPGGPGAGGEVHHGGGEPGRRRRVGDRVDVHRAGEPVRRSLVGVEGVAGDLHGGDLHRTSPRSGRPDSNRRPPAPKAGALPGCATPRGAEKVRGPAPCPVTSCPPVGSDAAMADVQPLRALHFDPAKVGSLQDVVAPPYDVIDPDQRAALLARSPYNVVAIDLPEAVDEGDDPYARAADLLEQWRSDGAIVRDDEPAIWALVQDFTGPDGTAHTRHGLFARVRVEEYGPGRIRPHERTHPGPREDRLRLTRATKANLSPIFSLYSDPEGAAWGAVTATTEQAPFGEATDEEATTNRLWRIADPDAIATVQAALKDAELLIADGHHRYETARVYADEVGGEGEHRYVLMCLVALEDPGLTVFPTHRLIRETTSHSQEALAGALRDSFDIAAIEHDELRPPDGDGPLEMGYIDSFFKRGFRLTLKDQGIADRALGGEPEPYRHLDTAILEALILKGPLGLTDDDIDHMRGLGYARSDAEALELVLSGAFDAAFFLRSTPVKEVQDVAATGMNMPPKTTFFYPKIPTGLVFNPLL